MIKKKIRKTINHVLLIFISLLQNTTVNAEYYLAPVKFKTTWVYPLDKKGNRNRNVQIKIDSKCILAQRLKANYLIVCNLTKTPYTVLLDEKRFRKIISRSIDDSKFFNEDKKWGSTTFPSINLAHGLLHLIPNQNKKYRLILPTNNKCNATIINSWQDKVNQKEWHEVDFSHNQPENCQLLHSIYRAWWTRTQTQVQTQVQTETNRQLINNHDTETISTHQLIDNKFKDKLHLILNDYDNLAQQIGIANNVQIGETTIQKMTLTNKQLYIALQGQFIQYHPLPAMNLTEYIACTYFIKYNKQHDTQFEVLFKLEKRGEIRWFKNDFPEIKSCLYGNS